MGIVQTLVTVVMFALSALMLGAVTVTRTEGPSFKIGGFGFVAVVEYVWDTSYPSGGEVTDFSTIFTNEVFGAWRISGSVNDGGWQPCYVRDGDATGATGAPATGTIQLYRDRSAAADAPLSEVTAATDVSAANHEYYLVAGR